jgi:hypothetical protein
VELEGAVQSANVKERKNSRQESTDQSGPAGIDISTALTAGQAYDSVVAAWRSGRLTDTQTKQAVELLKLRSGVVAHRANLAVQRQLAAPARRQVVEVGQSPASPIAEASTP